MCNQKSNSGIKIENCCLYVCVCVYISKNIINMQIMQ
jgi:hypothetical protein